MKSGLVVSLQKPDMSKINLIYVFGLARSGSTYFSKFLTDVFGAVSLGEIITNIEIFSDKDKLQSYRTEGRKCSCGETPENCELWGEFVNDIHEDEKKSIHYKILETIQRKYPDTVIIDTSKTTKRFAEYYMNNQKIKNLNINIIGINIVRHYAGHVASFQKYHRREGKKGIGATILADAYTWLNKNRKNIIFIENASFPSKTIIYEDLIFRTEEIKKEIESFVNSSFKTYKTRQPLMHEMGGNEGFKENIQSVRYDTSWMYEKRIAFLSLLLAPVIFFNKKWHDKYQPKKNTQI